MKFDLHPHQTAALDNLRTSLATGHRRPMVQAPTGSGKTIIAASIIHGALAKGKRVVFVVPFLELVGQTVAAFAEQGIVSVGVIQGYHPMTDALQPVQVASLQTLQRRKLLAADLVIVDEAHRWFDFMGKWMQKPEWVNLPTTTMI
jgi:superfamily II DNA or RNA helicase